MSIRKTFFYLEFPYNDFSNNDIYQVSTYWLLHGSHNAILFYPADKNNNEQIENYRSKLWSWKRTKRTFDYYDCKNKLVQLYLQLDNLTTL